MTTKRKADEAFAPRKEHDNRSRDETPSARVSRKAPQPGKAQDAQKSKVRDSKTTLLKSRQQLPIWPHADEIRQKVHDSDVLLVVGETGSGKSTQIPQFLHSEKWCQSSLGRVLGARKNSTNQHPSKKDRLLEGAKIGGRIAILQPRRVAAISLATRVAQEIGTPLGSSSPASTVGYSVRFDNNVSPSTKIKFHTDGMLLQELLRDHWLKEYSCVIVDEVHERGVNVDLVLGFLRRILDAGRGAGNEDGRGGVPLKVVVMSATADMEGIQQFFKSNPRSMPSNDTDATKQANPDSSNGKATLDEDPWNGFSDDEPAHPEDSSSPNQKQKQISVESCYIKGRQHTVTIHYTPVAVTNILDTAMDRIIQIHQHTPLPGDILVFLSGQEMIENLESLCHTYAVALAEQQKPPKILHPSKQKQQHQKVPSLQILPLFASLPTHLQARIFQPTPPFTRRIILSTNIAETSITVPGIRHVIDTGKHKSRLFRPGLNLDTLLSVPISQSMAKQRAGRAGREAPGHCYRLYTENDYWALEKDTKPEILQTDLAFLVLTLKAHDVDNVLGFPLLTQPPIRSLEAALEGLLNLEALHPDSGAITEIGRKMASLPVRPDLARILLEGSKHGQDILEGIIDIVSALSLEEGIFLPIHSNKRLQNGVKKSTQELLLGKQKQQGRSGQDASNEEEEEVNPVEAARRELLSRHSDHLTLLNAIQGYGSPSTHDRRAWCDQHGISHRAMSRIMDVRKQLRQMMGNSRFRLMPTDTKADTNVSNLESAIGNLQRREAILRCLITGLWPNIAILTALAPNQNQGSGVTQPQNPNQRAPYTTLLTNQGIHIHPSSIMFTQRSTQGRRKADEEDGKSGAKGGRQAAGSSGMPRAVIFTDLVYTSKPYARNVSAVELSWVSDMGKLS